MPNASRTVPQSGQFEIVSSYTRAQALEDGFQIDVSKAAKEMGFTFPVFITASVFQKCVEVPDSASSQSEEDRLLDVLWMLLHAIRVSERDASRISFDVIVENNTTRQSGRVELAAEVGPFDINDPRPTLTVMMPDED